MSTYSNASALFTDFYELTMAQGYWKNQMNYPAVFDMFFRRQPFNGGFSVFAGLHPLLEALEKFSFSQQDIEYLDSLHIFEDDFLQYLKDFHFSGDLYAQNEGSIVFPDEPLIRIHANLIEAQIIEGLVLNHINFQSLVATKTARVWLASGQGHIMEFGLRRAQGPDGAMSASRAAYIGGAAATSNALAGKLYNIPVQGTMAHSWIMSFPTELEAFESYAQLYPKNSIFLIDTYDTLNSGVKNAAIVGKKLLQKGHNFGVRLDSGDIQYLSNKVRNYLNEEGLTEVTISVSNELTEEIIQTLVQQRAPINSWGVGTHMVTGGSESSFTGVYKLAARYYPTTQNMEPTMKFSDNPEKTTNPGIKSLWRLYDQEGMARCDIMSLEDEQIVEGKEQRFYHPSGDYRQFTLTPAKVEPLLKLRIQKGRFLNREITPRQAIQDARKTMQQQLLTLDDTYKRILNPHIYKVSITKQLRQLKIKFIEERIK